MAKILIRAGKVEATATLNDTATARRILAALPIESRARLWGKEVYFEIPVHMDPDDAQAKVPSGTVAFWPDGDCLCLFYGQTPASPVNVVGTLDGDPNDLAQVKSGEAIQVEGAD
ncbi:MAG TPA: cyclophilin-like fold protein [Planctomycetota bacterium]|nr:cyclophilin-like fold protein [Planctomycetota bacterium]